VVHSGTFETSVNVKPHHKPIDVMRTLQKHNRLSTANSTKYVLLRGLHTVGSKHMVDLNQDLGELKVEERGRCSG
jgi:hypothetical protein